MDWNWLSFFVGCAVGVLIIIIYFLYVIYADDGLKGLKWLGAN